VTFFTEITATKYFKFKGEQLQLCGKRFVPINSSGTSFTKEAITKVKPMDCKQIVSVIL